MDSRKKVQLLKRLQLFSNLPESKLPTLAKFLEPLSLKDEAVVFEESSKGESLFFVSSGQIRIQKSFVNADGTRAFKDLAILDPGDCFGEMALFDVETVRSARAVASGSAVLFQLERKQLRRWLSSNPSLAVGFFNELVQVLTRRLRRSSNELTLLYDISQRLLTPPATGGELLQKVLHHLVPHLAGSWSGGAYLYNAFNSEMELVGAEGDFSAMSEKLREAPDIQDLPPPSQTSCEDSCPRIIFSGAKTPVWLKDRTYVVPFPGRDRLKGYLALHHSSALNTEEKNEVARTLATVARLIASALENIEHREEETLRSRLAAIKDMSGYPLSPEGRGLG